jgi:thiol-disulfide isomerase/thioredoxin
MGNFAILQVMRASKNASKKRFPLWLGLAALFVGMILLFGLGLPTVQASDGQHEGENHAIIYIFWGDGCPHCETARPILAEIAQKYEGVELQEFEVWNNQENQAKFLDFAANYGIQASGVPTIFIGTKYWVGWSEQVEAEVVKQVQLCLNNGCPDPLVDDIQAAIEAEQNPPPVTDANTITIPILNTVINLENQSLLASTLLIAFVDGFNPCSLWVLSMLMALTLRTGSRRKILIIGLVFLTVTAAVYALFIAGLFTFLSIINYVGWIQGFVALISLAFAAINIKDYFWYKEGVSLTISEQAKPGLYQKMRKVVQSSDSMPAMLGATIGLSAGVSLVEFSCTAGFPVLWTNLLTSQGVVGVTSMTFLGLLLVYMLIYQLDEMVIFGTVVLTLKASRLEEKQGRILKLVGGMLMLVLAGVMLINPAFMNDLGNSLLIFGLALVLTLLVLLVHRRVLPSMGIWIGSEVRPTKGKKARRRPSTR